MSRKVFHHVLAEDIEVGDSVLFIQPGYEQGEMCTNLVTVVSVDLRYYQIPITGRMENGNVVTVLHRPDQLVPVVQ